MKNIKILHTADLHLDSAFEALPAGKAAIRRAEQRELLSRLAELARSERADIVLLAGDIFDGGGTYFETGVEFVRCLRDMSVPVFIAPGNHDPYDARSPYAKLDIPQNVRIFTERDVECAELPELGVRVYGAAFTGSTDGPDITNIRTARSALTPSMSRHCPQAALTMPRSATYIRRAGCASRAAHGIHGLAARRGAALTKRAKRP